MSKVLGYGAGDEKSCETLVIFLLLILCLAYIPIAVVLVQIYFRKSENDRPFARLVGRSMVLAFFWGLGSLGVQGIAFPVPNVVGLVLQPIFYFDWWSWNCFLFLGSWTFYFVVYLIAMGIKRSSIALGRWD